MGTRKQSPTGVYPLPRPGVFTVHNPVVRGHRLYLSWYSDGVRVVDIADPSQPRELAHFVPPFQPGTPIIPGRPQLLGVYAMDWGVGEHHGLILLSDMQSGLWILRDLPQ